MCVDKSLKLLCAEDFTNNRKVYPILCSLILATLKLSLIFGLGDAWIQKYITCIDVWSMLLG